MKMEPDNQNNGPVEKEDQMDTTQNDSELEDENLDPEEEEDMDPQEFMKLNAELDALSSALDHIEKKNDSINDRLRKILEENRAIREAEEQPESESKEAS